MADPRYLDLEEFKRWAKIDTSTDDDLVKRAIGAAEDLLDEEAGRALRLVTDTTDEETLQLVPEPCSSTLWIPDAAEISTVTEDGTDLVDGTDYQAEPFDHLHPTNLSWRPFDRLVRLDRAWYTHGPRPTVTVTGKWGWTTIPSAVIEACTIVAADWWEHRNVRLGTQAVGPDGFTIGIRSSPAVRRAIRAVNGPKSIGIA